MSADVLLQRVRRVFGTWLLTIFLLGATGIGLVDVGAIGGVEAEVGTLAIETSSDPVSGDTYELTLLWSDTSGGSVTVAENITVTVVDAGGQELVGWEISLNEPNSGKPFLVSSQPTPIRFKVRPGSSDSTGPLRYSVSFFVGEGSEPRTQVVAVRSQTDQQVPPGAQPSAADPPGEGDLGPATSVPPSIVAPPSSSLATPSTVAPPTSFPATPSITPAAPPSFDGSNVGPTLADPEKPTIASTSTSLIGAAPPQAGSDRPWAMSASYMLVGILIGFGAGWTARSLIDRRLAQAAPESTLTVDDPSDSTRGDQSKLPLPSELSELALRPAAHLARASRGVSLDGSEFAVGWFEKALGEGEDALPAAIWSDSSGLIATFDGVGGAGASRVTFDGREMTEARLAADVCRHAVDEWFRGQWASDDADRMQLEFYLRAAIEEAGMITRPSKLRGSLRKRLPTTLASMTFDSLTPSGLLVKSYWVGDSRCYVLTADDGLRQTTRDHTRNTDALDQLINDGPMDNVISADVPFFVDSNAITVTTPAVLISATDGCFGYVMTPAHFEYQLLETMERSETAAQWAEALISAIGQTTSDDASFAMATVGYASFSKMKAAFEGRLQYLEQTHVDPFVGLHPSEDRETIAKLRMDSWGQYRTAYELNMPTRPSGNGFSATR